MVPPRAPTSDRNGETPMDAARTADAVVAWFERHGGREAVDKATGTRREEGRLMICAQGGGFTRHTKRARCYARPRGGTYTKSQCGVERRRTAHSGSRRPPAGAARIAYRVAPLGATAAVEGSRPNGRDNLCSVGNGGSCSSLSQSPCDRAVASPDGPC